MRLGSGVWKPCDPWGEKGYVGPASEGTWILDAQPINELGGPIGTPASALYTIDTTSPKVVWEQRPRSTHSSSSAEFRFRYTEPLSQGPTCRIDSGLVGCGSWAATVTSLSPGDHLFQVVARDLAGNLGSSNFWFTVETIGPTIDVVALPRLLQTEDPSPALEFESSDSADRYQCSIDATPWLFCTSGMPADPWLRQEGPHEVRVRGVDFAGNLGPLVEQSVLRLTSLRCPKDSAAVFSDVRWDHPFCIAINWSAQEGIASGYAEGAFRPAQMMTRQAASAFLYRALDHSGYTPPGEPTFTDVGLEHPFFDEIEWMVEEGITGGYDDGTFRPTEALSRQSISAMLYRALG